MTTTKSFYHENVYAPTGSKLNAHARAKAGTAFKHSLRNIVSELLREPGYTQHLDWTAPPIHVFGLEPDALRARVDEIEAAAKTMTEAYEIDGVMHTRKQRSTTPIALCAIASYPGPYKPDDADQEKFTALMVAAMKHQFGDNLRAIYAHTDEPNFHLHVFVDAGGAPAKGLHAGHSAAAEAAAQGLSRKAQQLAYNKAMVELQDNFHGYIGKQMGWERKSPSPQPRKARTQALADKQAALEADEAALVANRARFQEEAELFRQKAVAKIDEIAATKAAAKAELAAAQQARAEAEALKAQLLALGIDLGRSNGALAPH